MHSQQFIRNKAFFGEEGQKRIEDANITVVGLGGVGSHAAHMLARAGVGHFTFVDFDMVTVSSLNRHSVATRKDIGRPKVEVMKEHILDFNPTVDIRAFNTMMSKENLPQLLDNHPDFVVDCIDDYSTKTDLLEYCIRNNLEVIQLEKENLIAAKENYEIAMERYLLGDLPGIEMREAQKSLLDAEERILTAKYNTKVCEISLQQISGNVMTYME